MTYITSQKYSPLWHPEFKQFLLAVSCGSYSGGEHIPSKCIFNVKENQDKVKDNMKRHWCKNDQGCIYWNFFVQNSLILFNSIPSVQLSMETLKEWKENLKGDFVQQWLKWSDLHLV